MYQSLLSEVMMENSINRHNRRIIIIKTLFSTNIKKINKKLIIGGGKCIRSDAEACVKDI